MKDSENFGRNIRHFIFESVLAAFALSRNQWVCALAALQCDFNLAHAFAFSALREISGMWAEIYFAF